MVEEDLIAYYQRTNKTKSKLVVVFVILVILLAAITTYLYFQKVELKAIEDLTLEINTKMQVNEAIESVRHGKIKNNQEYLEVESVGEKTITIELENYFGKSFKKKITYNVVDTIAPTIENQLAFVFVYQNDELSNILSKIVVKDNSSGNITKTIEGEYDLSSIGTYTVSLTCKDEVGNEKNWPFKLIVEQHCTNESEDYTTFTTTKNYVGIVKNGVTYIDGYLIANKTYGIPSSFSAGMSNYVQKQFDSMALAAKKDGCKIAICSGYRSYETQTAIYTKWYKQQGQTRADSHSARPGHSEHQTGLAVDININNSSFASTKEFAWLQKNCYKYGFVLRYVKGKSDQTGYTYESWHYRYVGKELAEIIYNNGDWLTLEEYFGITSQYDHDFK